MAASPIAYLGPEGTFSHLVASRRFPKAGNLRACADLGTVFDVLAVEPSARAVVPIENSSGGTIYDTIDLLIAGCGRLYVQEDLLLDVRLALVGRSLEGIDTIFSHFVPLQHHRNWLKERFPGVSLEPVASTSLAASMAAKTPRSAALAARETAAGNGLKILLFPILPEDVNVTRFYVVGGKPAKTKATRRHKSVFVVRLKNICGSLHAFLGPFAKENVNLRMIVSRPVPGHPETYQFFVEVEGALEEPRLGRALKKASPICESIRSLGSFPTGKRHAS